MIINAGDFLALFPPGRTDAFGWHDGRRASVVKRSLDEFIIRQHLLGKSRVGFFPLNSEGQTRWGVIDIDDAGGSPVLDIVKKGREWGLKLAVEKSKSKGHHIWLLLADWTPTIKVRTILQGLLDETGWVEKWDFELFPKQTELANGAFGNYLFMPWHGGSLKEGRTVFVDIDSGWRPWADQVDHLRGLR